MARESIGRQVARAARAGGRGPGSRRSFERFHLILAAIVVVGIGLVTFSRWEAHHGATGNSTPPTKSDTWAAAVAFDICGKLQPDIPANPNLHAVTKGNTSSKIQLGLYTTGGGVVVIHPLTRADAGDNATLGRFVQRYPKMGLTSTTLRYPGQKTWHNGDSCGSKKGTVQVESWADSLSTTKGQIASGDPTTLKFAKGQLVTIAFVPKGTAIPRPPQSAVTALLNKLSTTSTKTSAPGSSIPATRPSLPSATVPRSPSTTAPKGPATTGTKNSVTPTSALSPTRSKPTTTVSKSSTTKP